MLRLFKNFNKKDYFIIFLCFVFVFAQVYLELKIPDYMSQITVLLQSTDNSMNDILLYGGYMLLCACY